MMTCALCWFTLFNEQRVHAPYAEKETMSTSGDEDAISDLMEQHNQFLGLMQSRLTKFQVFQDEKMLYVFSFFF